MLESNQFSRYKTRMTGKQKRSNIGKKVLKIPNQKIIHTGPTNSAGKRITDKKKYWKKSPKNTKPKKFP